MDNSGHDINDRCLYNYLEGRSQEGADLLFAKYGVTVDKSMNAREKRAIMAAIYEAGEKISEVIDGDESAAEAFSAAFAPITFTKSAVDYDGCVFQTVNKVSCSDFTYDYFQSDVNNVVHELGHVLNAIVGGAANNFGWPYARQRSRILRPDVGIDWQQHPEYRREDPVWTGGEMFGDMLVAWVFDAWNQDELNIGYVNRAREDLTTNMTEWLDR